MLFLLSYFQILLCQIPYCCCKPFTMKKIGFKYQGIIFNKKKVIKFSHMLSVPDFPFVRIPNRSTLKYLEVPQNT